MQLDEPVGGGAVALPEGDGELDGDADVADGVGWPLGDAEWLADALGVCEVRDADFGMTATWGAAASFGIRVADVLLEPARPPMAPPVVPAAAFGRRVVLCPVPIKLTAASPPAAITAAAVMPRIAPRDSGRPRNRGLSAPRVVSVPGPLVIWRTQPPIVAVLGEQ